MPLRAIKNPGSESGVGIFIVAVRLWSSRAVWVLLNENLLHLAVGSANEVDALLEFSNL